jgi:hypothetical protein
VASVTPSSGAADTATQVTIAGTGFATGATVTIGGSSAAVTAATATSLSVLTPPHALGAVDVVVTNPDGQSATLLGGFTYTTAALPPLFTSIAPATGLSVGGDTVVITGKEFITPTVAFGGVFATLTAISATSLTAVTPPHAAGAVDVVITNADGQTATGAGAFTYLPTVFLPPPVVTSLTPASGPQNGGTAVVVNGNNFVAGSTVTIGGVAAPVGAITATTIAITTPTGVAGPAAVVVTNPDRQSATLVGGYTYIAPAPVVAAINVHGAPQAGGSLLLLAGSGLINAASVTFGGVPAAGLTYDPLRNAITVVVPPSPAGPTADVFVPIVVTNLDGQFTTVPSFHYGNPPAPTGFTPNTGPKGNPLVISGTDFTADTAGQRVGLQVAFGGVPAVITAKSATQIDVTIPKLNPGVYQVIVTNFDGQFAVSPGTFTAPGP